MSIQYQPQDGASEPKWKTVWWEEDEQGAAVCLVDQSVLPQEIVSLHLRHEQQVADAITSLKVRGAPAIGVTAAFGMALAVWRVVRDHEEAILTTDEIMAQLQAAGKLLGRTRPTAVNLFWAIERMRATFQRNKQLNDVEQVKKILVAEALAIFEEDIAANRAIGHHGGPLIPDNSTVLTHCNAGALATAGDYGTALGVIRGARDAGKKVAVIADETRPFLQGLRLTAWELAKDDIPVTVITDNMAGHVMKSGKVDAVVVGADRIAANGDTANKIGTYMVAVLAREHGVPFYVAAPLTTLDMTLASGDEIPIEERDSMEVTHIREHQLAPDGVNVHNPAFDVTPHQFITAIITDKGVARPPYVKSLKQLFEDPR